MLLPFSPPAPERAWWAQSVLRIKAAVALSERKSVVDLAESVFCEPVDAGREIAIASLGWSRDVSSSWVVMASRWASSLDYDGLGLRLFINFHRCAGKGQMVADILTLPSNRSPGKSLILDIPLIFTTRLA